MFGPLTIADYPLFCVGSLVYRRTESSPIATFATPELAADICARVNRTLAPYVEQNIPDPLTIPPWRAAVHA